MRLRSLTEKPGRRRVAVFQCLHNKNLPPSVVLNRCYPLPNRCGWYILFFHRRISARYDTATSYDFIFLPREMRILNIQQTHHLSKPRILHSGGSNYSSRPTAEVELLSMLISLHTRHSGVTKFCGTIYSTDGHLRASVTLNPTDIIYSIMIIFELANELCIFDT